MTISTGTRLGPYEVIAPIGAGGMGEVYKAKDTRLDRTVAIKVLPEHLAESPERKARFEREAKAISQLNHPHICTLYDVGEQDGIDFIVMEYIEGETLAERLKKGALKLDQALEYGIQIADGLDKAHRAGIVHRDLKPGNVMLTKSGVKLLDFGLARLVEEGGDSETSDAPTRQKDLTAEESIVGTLQYMAPEQLERKPADARTDIFAFGVLLYEMVTGNKAFEGKSQASLIGAILHTDPPPLKGLEPMTPEGLDYSVRVCLAKDPEERWQSARDLARELKRLESGGSVSTASPAGSRAGPRRRLTVVAVALGVAMAAGIVVWSLGARNNLEPSPSRLSVALPPDLAVNLQGYPVSSVAISPDGSEIVFAGRTPDDANRDAQLYIRSLNDFDIHPLPATEGAKQPFYSPNGQWVAFFTLDGRLRKVSRGGGEAVTILDGLHDTGWTFGSWGDDDTIVFSSGLSGIFRVPSAGGTAEALTRLDAEAGEIAHEGPKFLPGSRAVVFQVTRTLGNTPGSPSSRIDVIRLDSGERQALLENAVRPTYLTSGHLVFGRDRGLMAAPFDADRLEITGPEVRVAERVRMDDDAVPQIAVSRNGTLVYVPPVASENERALMWVDPQGVQEPLAAPHRAYAHPRLSPDGGLIVVAVREGPGQQHLHLYDLRRNVLTQFTQEGYNASPLWTPDGRRVAFWSTNRDDGPGIYWKPIDGSAPAEMLLASEEAGGQFRLGAWSMDGSHLAYTAQGTKGSDIWVLTLSDNGPRDEPFLDVDSLVRTPMFSPDGSWLAYASEESGHEEVYLQRYPGGGNKLQVSDDGGFTPVWASGSSSLYYQTYSGIMEVPVTTDPELRVGTPTLLFRRGSPSTAAISGARRYVPYALGAWYWGHTFDVAAGGDRLLMVYEVEDPWRASELRVVQGWARELDRLFTISN